MVYKLLIVRNRFTDKIKVQKGLDWFKKNTPLEITTEEITTDFDVTTEKISNATYSGVICGEDIYPKLRTVVPEGKYHAVVFIYGNNLDGIRVNASKALPLYPGTDLIQLCITKDGGTILNHEMFHTFFHRLQRQQVMVEDPMDSVTINGKVYPYYNNKFLDAKPSNRSIALERLSKYWDKVATILLLRPVTPPLTTVNLKRNFDDGIQTLGELNVDGFKCLTLERPWKNNTKNISCIPTGTYLCKYTFSPKFLKYTYELKDTSPRTGIRIHSGNFFFDIEGCILLGDSYKDLNRDGKVDVQNSKITIQKFEGIMGKKDFLLVIK